VYSDAFYDEASCCTDHIGIVGSPYVSMEHLDGR
jgi:hypothetical protein